MLWGHLKHSGKWNVKEQQTHVLCVSPLFILMLHCHIWLCLQDTGWQWQSIKPSSGPFCPWGAVWLQRSRFYNTLSTAFFIAHAILGFCMVNSTKLSWGFQLCSLHSWSSTVSYFSRSFTLLSCSAFYTKYLIIQLSILKFFHNYGCLQDKVKSVYQDSVDFHDQAIFSSLASSSGFPGSSDGKASAYNVRDPGSVPGLERSPGEGNGNPLRYSCLENPMDREAW